MKNMTNEVFEKTLFDLKETIVQTMGTPVNKAGWPFIIGFACVSIVLAMLSTILGFVGLVLTLWCLYFFRDPIRYVPLRAGLVMSPADGRVTAISEAVALPRELRPAGNGPSMVSDPAEAVVSDDGEYTRVSIFLSVFDVHVNRVPVGGVIKKIVYKPGLFLNAGNERASMENERCAILLETPDQKSIGFVQIAGLIARRIICDAKEGDTVATGMRYGLIRFGSRMDIYLPKDATIHVAVGQRAIGGETVLADLNAHAAHVEAQPI